MTTLHAIHQQIASPSGVSYALSARLTPSCLQETSTSTSKVVRNLVTARSNYLQVFEVRETVEEHATAGLHSSDHAIDQPAQRSDGVNLEEGGQHNGQNGFTDALQGSGRPRTGSNVTARLQFVREHTLHGTITGLQRLQTIDTAKDGLDRLLISFENAKMTLLEWSADLYDLVPVSLHTFEKLPHIIQGDLTGYRSITRTDPSSRCAALLLPQDALAITPFFQDQIELEGAESRDLASLPYAPSFVLELLQISPRLHNIVDFVFLPGFNEPTLAILSQPQQTWAGRLENAKDTMQLFLLTIDVTATPPSSTIISTTAFLPYDCSYLTACPKDLGGVLVTTPNSIIHVDQSGKRTGVASNSWANLVTSDSKVDGPGDDNFALEGSKVMFISSDIAILFLHEGTIRAVKIQRDGRTISRVSILPETLGKTVVPSDIELIRSHLTPKAENGATRACYAFVASTLGDSEIIRIDFGLEQVETNGMEVEVPDILKREEEAAEMDEDDIDIYGSADAKADALLVATAAHKAATTKLVLNITHCQRLPGYGPIHSAALGVVEEDAPPELVACTGDELSGGLTILHRSLLLSNRRTLNLDHPTENIWCPRIFRKDGSSRTFFVTSADRETQIYTLENDTTEPHHQKTFGKTTLSVGTLHGDSCLAYLLADSLRIVGEDFSERQTIKFAGNEKARSADFCDPYVLIRMQDARPLLYKVKEDTGNLEEIPLPAHIQHGDAIALFADSAATFPLRKPNKRKVRQAVQPTTNGDQDMDDMNNDDDIYGDSDVKPQSSEVPKEEEEAQTVDLVPTVGEVWLCSCSTSGGFSITCVSSLENGSVFDCSDLLTLPTMLANSGQTEAMEDIPEGVAIDQMCLAYIGQERLRPHLSLLLEDGTCVVYECVPDHGRTVYRETGHLILGVRFLKTHYLPIGTPKRSGPKVNGSDALGPAQRRFVPFADVAGRSGLILTGDSPLWLLAEDLAPSRLFECAMKPAYGFSTAFENNGRARCLISVGEETIIGDLPANTYFGRELPYTKVVQNRLYLDVAFDQPTKSYLALATFSAPFDIFDDEGESLNKLHGPGEMIEPTATRSAIELIEPGSWKAVDGYEFRQYETAMSVKSVSLESKSTESGYKDFIAVGTTITRGEDLASRGAVIKGEPAPGDASPRRALRLLFMEDLKSAVGIVDGLDGYLIHSVGLKINVKGFEQDEKLLAVGFLDVNVYTTCIRTMKNLTLLGDAVNGLNFVAFQEDPYKIVSLAREVRGNPVVTADFLVMDNKCIFLSTDMHGVIRIFEYDPMHVETGGGQRLLPRVEFRAGMEAAFSLPFARASASDAKQNGVLYFNVDGSMSTVVPVKDAVYRRLQLLERQLVRHTHHFAGLNPRAYRSVRNDTVPRPLTKGLLDGTLLSKYSMLSTVKQQQLADPLGSDSDTINYNLKSLKSPWQ